ncbi:MULTISPECIES: hypothetical protein [Williamsia]|uniref:Uncharacterized protein n=1 Tax=Williamsia herbipolensis TaxID=1603258 RepID=A0AAU4K0X1_9NOCA|nr:MULTISPECIES: hypothetical protein [Williamsia]MCX6467792.1 hypothetical protein [Mycobacteriales bacterium]
MKSPHGNPKSIELALQEFEVEQLDDLDAPGWSDALSAIGGLSVGGAISYSAAVSILT